MATQNSEITKIITLELHYDDLVKGMTQVRTEVEKLNKGLEEEQKNVAENKTTQEAYAQKLEEVTVKKKELNSIYRQYQKELQNNIKKEVEAEGSLNSLRAQLSNLTKQYNAMSREVRDGEVGQNLVKQMANVQQEISKAEIAIGNFRSRVGSYADAAYGFTKLNYSIQQVVRETPSLTHSLTQYFSAISNNLPMLADEIKRINEQNAELKRQGLPTQNVLKGIVSSLFSWETALVAGITLLTAYGEEIADFIAGLFKARKEVDATTEATKNLTKVRRQAIIDSQEEIVQLRLMQGAAEDVNRSMEERLQAVKNLRDEYPDYLANLSDEEVLNGKLAESVDKLVERIVTLNKARGALNELVENEENRQRIEAVGGLSALEDARNRAANDGGSYDVVMASMGNGFIGYQKTATNAQKEYNKLQENFLSELEKGSEEGKKLAEEIREKFNSDVLGYIEYLDASKEELEAMAEALYTTPDSGSSTTTTTKGGNTKNDSSLNKNSELERLRKEVEKVADETFKIYHEAIEKTREEELRIHDETQARKIAIIEARQAEISAAQEAGTIERNGKELEIDQELYARLTDLYNNYEAQKKALNEMGAKERSAIEAKWAEAAMEEALQEQEQKAREFLQRLRSQQRGDDKEYSNLQKGNRIEERNAGLNGNTMNQLKTERGNIQEEILLAQQQLDELDSDFYSESEKQEEEYLNAKEKAMNRLEDAKQRMAENDEEIMRQAAKSAEATLSGFSAVAGGFAQLAEALGADAGVVRGMAIAQSALALAAGIASAATTPFPGNLVAIASVLGTLATIITQIKQLNSESEAEQYAQGGLIPISGNAGIIKGRSHSSGGVAVSIDGKKVAEVEGGELLAVVNKKDTAQLNALSALNSLHGRKFADGGLIDFSGIYSSLGLPASGNIIQTQDTSAVLQYELMRSAMIEAVGMIRPQVAVRDISKLQKTVSVRDSFAKQVRGNRKK